jgi:hypothetical protein
MKRLFSRLFTGKGSINKQENKQARPKGGWVECDVNLPDKNEKNSGA